MLGTIVTGLVLVVWAALFAMLEIAIEGPVGWALAAPTWRKKSRLYGAVMSGKELTGYHLVMFFLPYLFLHLPFVFGLYWGINVFSWWHELEIIASFFLLSVCWDWWWFVLNPFFGLKRFRRGEIWWHAQWVGRVPVDYIFGIGLVAVLTAVGAYHDRLAAMRMGIVFAIFVLASLLIIVSAPRYHRWCEHMKSRYGDSVEGDWTPYVGGPDSMELDQLLELIDQTRLQVAAIGRKRAQAEQLGIR